MRADSRRTAALTQLPVAVLAILAAGGLVSGNTPITLIAVGAGAGYSLSGSA